MSSLQIVADRTSFCRSRAQDSSAHHLALCCYQTRCSAKKRKKRTAILVFHFYWYVFLKLNGYPEMQGMSAFCLDTSLVAKNVKSCGRINCKIVDPVTIPIRGYLDRVDRTESEST